MLVKVPHGRSKGFGCSIYTLVPFVRCGALEVFVFTVGVCMSRFVIFVTYSFIGLGCPNVSVPVGRRMYPKGHRKPNVSAVSTLWYGSSTMESDSNGESRMQNTIYVRKDAQGTWLASHHGPIAREVEEFFGTTVLPTPWFGETSESFVISQLQHKNPDCIVKSGS